MDSLSDDFDDTKKKSDIPWLIGGAVVLAGVGYLLYRKQTSAQAAKAVVNAPIMGNDPATWGPGAPGAGTTTTGTTPAAEAKENFREYPASNKVALWKILSMFPLTSADETYFSIGSEPATGSTPSAAARVSLKDQAAPGAVYTLVNPDDGTLLFVDRGTAASQASGPNAPWALFLRPGEWQTVSAAAAKDAGNLAINAAQLPPNLDPVIIQTYARTVGTSI